VLGVTVFAMWRDWERADELLDRAQQSGSPWLRVDMGWCSLEERGPGQVSAWYQDRLDAVVAGANRRGLQLLMMVACAPAWAGGTAAGSYPTDPAEFQRVTRYLADRYRGRVPAWEIWNEPDCIGGCPNGSPSAFVPVLQAGYRGIKAGDPGATVVSGGISGNNADWIARMYAAGAQGWFDALAVHPYLDPVTAAPDAPAEQRVYRMTSVAAVHAVMQRNGDGDLPIWFTEFGWTTARSGDRPGVDEAVQAGYLRQAVELIARDYPYVTHAFWFALRDRDDWTPYENEFGLLHVDGSEKPSYAALRAANAWLAAR
jgi:beta-xylosidase